MEIRIGTLVVDKYNGTLGIVVESCYKKWRWVVKNCTPFGTPTRDETDLIPLFNIPEADRGLAPEEIVQKYRSSIFARMMTKIEALTKEVSEIKKQLP